MESGRFFFDPSACHGNMTFLGNRDSIFREIRSGMNMEKTSNKRLFFSSPMDLFDEEYYDEQLPEKKRRLTVEQVHLLEKSFEEENKLEPERKNQLAKKLGLQPRQVAVWFQNRRSRWKTKQLEMEYHLLKSSYESLRCHYESILKETDKLKFEVNSLTEKLQEKSIKETTPDQTESLPPTEAFFSKKPSSVHLNTKVEDRLSSGSATSAVLDEEGLQLVDSCDSYFPNHDISGEFLGSIHEKILEEDDGTDGQRYFPDVFAAMDHLTEENQDTLGWWAWY